MTREYIRCHVEVVAKVYATRPLPAKVIDIITDKVAADPGVQAGNEFRLGEGCRHYIEEVNKLIEAAKK